jgi:hypothetical protein
MGSKLQIKWERQPADHDYPAARSYLSLVYDGKAVERLVRQFKAAAMGTYLAKDLFRASGLSCLGVSNSHVEADRQKIRSGIKLSPLLLVRDTGNGKLVIADGYHRLCAAYSIDEDAAIPCKIV